MNAPSARFFTRTQTASAYAALCLGVIAISWSAIFVRWTLISGIASAFYRVLFASLAIWPLLIFSKNKPPRLSQPTLCYATLGGAFFAADLGLYNVAVLHTTAGSATFLSNSSPLFVGLLTWAVTRKLPSRRFCAALAVALSGACLIVAVDLRHPGSGYSADLLAITASVCFALYLIATERLRATCNTATLLALSTTASAALLLAFSVLAHISLAVPNIHSLGALLASGIVCQLVGYFCLTYALGHLPATVTSVMLLAIAPLTALFALMTFGERMTALQTIGGVLVLIGVWIVSGSPRISSQPGRTRNRRE